MKPKLQALYEIMFETVKLPMRKTFFSKDCSIEDIWPGGCGYEALFLFIDYTP
jgi:hypothetical protein